MRRAPDGGERRLDRRRFLGAALGGGVCGAAWLAGWGPAAAGTRGDRAAGSAPAGEPATPARGGCDEARAVARRHIQTHCCRLDFPNGAIHAVRALGREAPLGAGDPFQLVLERFVVENWVAQRGFLEVPVEREGHRNAMLKTLLEAGCEPDLEFSVQGRRHRFADVIESARLLAAYPGNLDIDEQSWTIIALSRVVPAGRGRWTNVHGQIVDLGVMIDDTSVALERDTALVREIDLRQADPPRDCPALSRACGGLHMLYALAAACASGYATPARRAALAGHLRTAVLRLTYDESVIASVERQNTRRAGAEAAHAVAFDARVKLLGHLLETFGVVDQHRLYTFMPHERREIDAARARLCAVLGASREFRFERYRSDHDLYESLTTGVCHAYNGLRLSPA
jgi:hypothetical protein